MSKKVTVKARVQLLLDVDVSGVWDGSCCADEIFVQAERWALEHVRCMNDPRLTVVQVTKVVGVIVEEGR